MTIKNISKNDLKKVDKLMIYCFGMGLEPSSEDEIKEYQETIDLNYAWGYYNEEDELISTWIAFPWQAYFRGKLMKYGAIADVTTQPEYRQKGYIRELFLRSLKQMKDTGYLISGLNPFKYSYYEKFGYALGSETIFLKCNPTEILLPNNFTLLKVKEIPKEETFKKITPIRNEFGKRYNFIYFTDEKTWLIRMFRKNDYIFGIYNLEGKLEGYIISKITKLQTNIWDSALDINETLATTRDAFLTILDFIKKHTDQTAEFHWKVIDDELTFINFIEKYAAKVEIRPATMYRIIDVQKALEVLDYPQTIDDSISLRIYDKYADWNNGYFKLTINKGKAICQKIDETEADLEIDINSFTQLFMGYKTIQQLIFSTSTKAKEEKIAIINTILPKCHTKQLTHF
ncbi:MAG: GNAT family N-acetyltransferase [Candidatus Heimdallarchaeota archaeon]|nr:GNAT family N-acetyltransferase [Candidatus Heimdallarchaeota archaeon]